ncbi:MAG: hypothetical protein EGP82_00180 [Odoribacter splanchnicus]|nr:hypothetical protein [Odoribacter splanchnicus]
MMKSFNIYRNGSVIYQYVVNDTESDSLSGDNSISFTIASKEELDIKINDYILVDSVKYSIFNPVDIEESNGIFTYPLTFYWPGYKLNFSIIEDEGATTFSYHGYVRDFLILLLDSLKKDYPEFILGEIEDSSIIDLSFDNSNCMAALQSVCEAAEMEWNIHNTTINVKKRIGTDTDYIFEYGKNKGGYSVRLSKVANASITTRMIGKGGTANLPADYVSPDSPKRLNLGNEVLEKNVEKYGRITGVYTNDNIYPRLINKTVLGVTIPENIETAGSWKLKLDIPFDLSQQYAPNEVPLVKFQTGDLTGLEFEIVENSWNNTDKTLSIIVQEESDGYYIPNKDRQPKVGDVFVLLNILMPQSYIDEATEELRKATQNELDRKCEPQYAPSLTIQKHYLKKKGIVFHIGDGITIKIGSQRITTRIIGISQSSSSDEVSVELGDQMLYTYDAKTNNTLEQIQTTLKQLISIEDIRRLFNNLINAWYPKWFNQKLHKDADVEFNSVRSKESVTTNRVNSETFVSGPLGEGFRIDENGNAEFQNLNVRGTFSVFELLIQQIRAIGGQLLVSPASIKIALVEDTETGYKCSFNTESGTIPNPFIVGDQLVHQVFTGNSINRYWRLVTETGSDYFVLSKTDCEANSGIPAADDEVMLLGNRTDSERQAAILISAYGSDTPFVAYYSGINSFSLAGKEVMREGNLKGIVDKDLGQLQGFGLYASNVYLKGAFRLFSGKDVGDTLIEQQSQIDTAKSIADSAQQNVMQVTQQITDIKADMDGFSATVTQTQEKVDNLQIGGVNYLNGSRLDSTNGWVPNGGTVQVVEDGKFGQVVEYSRPGGGGDFMKFFGVPIAELSNTQVVYYVIAKKMDADEQAGWLFGGWTETFTMLNSATADKVNLGDGWYQYWVTFKSGDSICSGGMFGLNSIGGTWRFYAAGVLKGNKPTSWSLSLPDQKAQAEEEAQKKVDALQIGIRNLILKSNESATGAGYPFKTYDLNAPLEVGKEYTAVINGRSTGTSGMWMYIGGSQQLISLKSDTDKTMTSTFICQYAGNQINIYHAWQGSTGESTVNWCALYEGNKAPDNWVPAIEDTQEQIDETKNSVEIVKTNLQTQIDQKAGSIELSALREDYNANKELVNKEIGEIKVGYNQISATVTGVDERLGVIETSGFIAEKDFVNIFSKHENELGDKVVNSINVSPEGIKINANKIEISGQTIFRDTANNQTFSIFSQNGFALNLSNNFKVSTEGKLYATGAEISGKLISNSNGDRIIIDPNSRSLSMITSANKETLRLFFYDTSAQISLTSADDVYETVINPSGINIATNGNQHYSWIRAMYATFKVSQMVINLTAAANTGKEMYILGLDYFRNVGEATDRWATLMVHRKTGRIAMSETPD